MTDHEIEHEIHKFINRLGLSTFHIAVRNPDTASTITKHCLDLYWLSGVSHGIGTYCGIGFQSAYMADAMEKFLSAVKRPEQDPED